MKAISQTSPASWLTICYWPLDFGCRMHEQPTQSPLKPLCLCS